MASFMFLFCGLFGNESRTFKFLISFDLVTINLILKTGLLPVTLPMFLSLS
ncbi:MAG: hypothetical protein BWY67_01894 [Bacteroidetes bacterium ADurb.Bin397]|nr:MAG: hypothetical protein BWY67_01894 [Bacteroidetes bacterium ADurb.Bin397]